VYSGKVASIATTRLASQPGQAATTNPVVRFRVEVLLNSVPTEIKSGMTAQVTMRVINRKDVVRIPLEYVGREGNKRFVLIAATPPAKPEKRTVEVGASSGAFVEIKGGLKQGEKIIKPEFEGPPRQGLIQFG
jgi:multidrug efflux pump subunit AcrA (membrane-fusion protein)